MYYLLVDWSFLLGVCVCGGRGGRGVGGFKGGGHKFSEFACKTRETTFMIS